MGFISTYPPTDCGIATFTMALRRAIGDGRGSDVGLGVVALVETRDLHPRPEVSYQHLVGDSNSLNRAVEVLNTFDVAVVQHEYGIYGGRDGAEVVNLVSRLEIPAVVVLHTIPIRPTPGQRVILESLIDKADRAIVMSLTGLERLETSYQVDPRKIRMIPHGASPALAGPRLANLSRPMVLTWGLLGPGKGLETSIAAFATLKDLRPVPRFVILGETHPKVRATQGDAYLRSLKFLVGTLGLEDVVEFDTRYLDLDSLIRVVRQADTVLIGYESTEQATSGVLVEAVAAGKPVIATAFPHAVEVLGSGAGLVVPHSDPDAMSHALRRVLTEPNLASRMAGVARSIASTLFWPAVAARYERMVDDLTERDPPALTVMVESTARTSAALALAAGE